MVNLVRHAVIQAGVVVNIINYADTHNGPVDGIDGIAVASDSAQIGYVYDAGLFAAPVIELTPLPISTVSMRQARAAMITQGIHAVVDAAIAALPGLEGDLARNTWDYATTVRRDNTLLVSLSSQLGLTAEQLDELFALAATL